MRASGALRNVQRRGQVPRSHDPHATRRSMQITASTPKPATQSARIIPVILVIPTFGMHGFLTGHVTVLHGRPSYVAARQSRTARTAGGPDRADSSFAAATGLIGRVCG